MAGRKKRSEKQMKVLRRAGERRWTDREVEEPKQPAKDSEERDNARHTRRAEKFAIDELKGVREQLQVVNKELSSERTIRLTLEKRHEASEEALVQTQDELEKALENTTIVEGELGRKGKQLADTRNALKTVEKKLAKAVGRTKKISRKLQTSQQAMKRARALKNNAKAHLGVLQCSIIPSLHAASALAVEREQLARISETAALRQDLQFNQQQQQELKQKLTTVQNKARQHQMRALRAVRTLATAQNKHHSKLSFRKSMEQRLLGRGRHGTYSSRFRAIIRTLALAGCAQDSIGRVIRLLYRSVGVTLSKDVSQRTVSRTLLEGGIASQIQVAAEMEQATAITISSDDTSHRNINYSSKHATLTTRRDDGSIDHQVRFLGVESTLDHTSIRQAHDWELKIQTLSALYTTFKAADAANEGTGTTFGGIEFTKKLMGVHGDHAADQKATFKLLQKWKERNTYLGLGYEVMHSGNLPSDEPAYGVAWREANDALTHQVGGPDGWAQLEMSEQASKSAEMLEKVAMTWGKLRFTALLPDERRARMLLVRAGCCMHKDLNCVKIGNTKMMAFWEESGLAGPLLLPNRDNAATIQEVDEDEELTEAQSRAINVTSRGGIKVTNLAGAIFNHKDDKKGLQDTHWHFMEQVVGAGEPTTFPDTSNTRYGSHCHAAAWLVRWQGAYISLLETVRDNKQKATFSHIESNLYKALHDEPTLTELVVLAVYGIAISSPTCGGQHVKMLSENPNLLLEPGHTAKATLDGSDRWENHQTMAVVHGMAESLPHLSGALISFLRGAVEGWERFSAEFRDDGEIAALSETERQDAWMSSTNDANEGALGTFRQLQNKNPGTSMHQVNARMVFKRNNTDVFMETLTDKQHEFLVQTTRQVDASGIEKKRRKELTEHKARTAVKKREAQERFSQRKEKKKQRLDELELILDEK
ncbi:hypothetical protein CONPUDRAFT_78464, partial [Coniophora puteana RWD-64-598 SS2]